MKSKTPYPQKPVRSKEVPVTAGMLDKMESRLIHKMEGVKYGLEGRMKAMQSDISEIKAQLHRTALMVEEQKAQNKYVLDGYAQLYDGFTRLDDSQAYLRDGFTRLIDGQAELREGFTRLNDGQAELRDSQAQMRDDLARLNDGQARLYDLIERKLG